MTRTPPSGALAKGITIIDTLALHGELSPAALASMTGIPRPTVYRILGGLADVGLVSFQDESTATLTLKWLQLADAGRDAMTEWRSITSHLPAITDACGMTSFLSIRRNDHTICIQWTQGTGIDALILRPGRTLPLHAGAAGRAALASLDDEDVESYLARAPFHPFNHRTLVTAQDLLEDVKTTRERGYALSEEDVTLGVGAVGVPVIDPAGPDNIAYLSVGGLIGEISRDHRSLADLLHAEARRAFAQGTPDISGQP